MAQVEDTELRDLLIEALEKNGSLAKIRALLRANVFLAFEDNYDNIRQNVALDHLLSTSEGIFALSLVHEFLEFCNLKNTLFVYKSETRQEKEYKHESRKRIYEKMNLSTESNKEPALLSLIKSVRHNIYCNKNNVSTLPKNDNNMNYKDDQNCTYIVHEDCSSTSPSQSDNSSDEKTKLHLRLQLDNSDTDTSSDSTRDKSSSEYIPNEHILQASKEVDLSKSVHTIVDEENYKNCTLHGNNESVAPYFLNNLKSIHNSSSESTSYVDIKPFSKTEDKLSSIAAAINTENIKHSPNKDTNEDSHRSNKGNSYSHSNTLNSISSLSHKKDECSNKKVPIEESESAEYSYDFSLSGVSKIKDDSHKSPPSLHNVNDCDKIYQADSPHDNSQSSRSSISISDVADLISEKSDIVNMSKTPIQHFSKSPKSFKSQSNDSDDFSESSVPSLSNLSMNIQSE